MFTGLKVKAVPLVTIAIPTLDRFEYLREAVASALAQTYERIEVVIGDDGPTETIQAWSQRLVSEDTRVRYQRNPSNLGLAGNWNALADAALGEFLVIIGDDDRLLPTFVETMMEAIKPTLHVAFSNHYLIDSNGTRLEALTRQHTHRYRRDQLPAGQIVNAAACVWQNSIPMSAAVMRTKDVQRLRFKEDLNTPEIEFFARLAEEGGRFSFVPAYLSEYRMHPLSATSAGLRGERLVKYLDAIPVSREVERYKREFMADLLVNAVSRCLQENNQVLAREFLQHRYYPRLLQKRSAPPKNGNSELLRADSDGGGQQRPPFLTQLARNFAQRFCARLPTAIGCRLYRLLQRVKPGYTC